MKKDKEIKQKLETKITNKKCFDGFKILVKNGIVQVEKDGIKTKKGFLYDDGAKDFHGNDWNMGALGNLVIRWENENKLEAYNEFEKCKYFRWGGCLSTEKNINFECCTKNKDCEFKKKLRGFNNV